MMALIGTLAEISLGGGSGVIHLLLVLLIIMICGLLVWWLGNWAFRKLGAPAIMSTIWTGIFIFIAVIFLINFLLGLVGRPFFAM
jgi:hypothetical protein